MNNVNLIWAQLPNGKWAWVHPKDIGLGLFKSKARKEAEKALPEAQATIKQLTAQVNSLTNSQTALQNSLVKKDQIIRELSASSQGGAKPNLFKNPVVIGSLVFGLLGMGFGAYQLINNK